MAHAHTSSGPRTPGRAKGKETTTKTLAILLCGEQGTHMQPHALHLSIHPRGGNVRSRMDQGPGTRGAASRKYGNSATDAPGSDPGPGSDVAINVSIVSFWP